jgi:putative flippase GtrA
LTDGQIIMIFQKLADGSGEEPLRHSPSRHHELQSVAMRIPRPLRFRAVGALGLTVNLALFTLLLGQGLHPLVAGLLALAGATVLTWRLNRVFTFDRSARAQHEEALRYAAVTAVAQSVSYGVFAVLVSTLCAALPQAAVVIGAAAGALVSYNGHRLFAFAPLAGCPRARNP